MNKTTNKARITRDDLMPMDEYAAIRKEHRRKLSEKKKNRRVSVGPFATFYFENYETMWAQIHEMLHIERGGEAQIDGELAAYNPLIPNGHELVATMMFEIADPDRRNRELAQLGGAENHFALLIGDARINAVPEDDVDRTNATGKTSAVHFVRFALTDAEIDAFRNSDVPVMVSIDHPHYGHVATIPPDVRAALSEDFLV